MNHLPLGRIFFTIMAGCLLFTACKNQPASGGEGEGYTTTVTFHPGEESKIIETLLSLRDSTCVILTQGTYTFDNLSIAQLKHILIKGEGYDKTILDFSSQTQGGEGIRVTDVKGFTIRDMTIRDSKGDLIKINKSRDVTVTGLHAVWRTADSTSGGYAIYPVLCKNVLIDSCYVEGSSDAGIYVGQTDSAIVRNCKGAKNVAGCEIENTSHALVYNNEFYDNTAGFLIFDLPGLSKRGGGVKAYDNFFHDNNQQNFAKSGSFGTLWGVGNASPGTGMVILAASDIEVYHNRIINNNSCSVLIASGFAVDKDAASKINDNYFPISRNIKVHDNTLEMGDAFPQPAFAHRVGKLLISIEKKLNDQDPARKNMRIPFVVYDGITTNVLTNGKGVNPDTICIKQAGSNVFVDADMGNITDAKKWHPTTDIIPFSCQ